MGNFTLEKDFLEDYKKYVVEQGVNDIHVRWYVYGVEQFSVYLAVTHCITHSQLICLRTAMISGLYRNFSVTPMSQRP